MEEVREAADAADEIAAMYRSQIRSSVHDEAQRRLASLLDPYEEARLKRASITALVGCSTFGAEADAVHGDLVPALMARLGDVRSALTGHGGGLVVISAELQMSEANLLRVEGDDANDSDLDKAGDLIGVDHLRVEGDDVGEAELISAEAVAAVSLLLSLDGACISCGAAPGTLSGIRDDLLADPEITDVAFDRTLLEHYDDLAREFLEMASGVIFR
jgi:hypothetical protein